MTKHLGVKTSGVKKIKNTCTCMHVYSTCIYMYVRMCITQLHVHVYTYVHVCVF